MTVATSDLFLVGADFVLGILWLVVARSGAEALRTGRTRGPISTLMPPLAYSLAAVYLLAALFPLFPFSIDPPPPTGTLYLYFANDVAGFLSVALFRHMAWYFQIGAVPPTRRWLAVNYGSVALGAAIAMVYPLLGGRLTGSWFVAYTVFTWTYLVLMLASTLRPLSRRARGGGWRPGSFGPAARPDLIVLGIGFAILCVVIVVVLSGLWTSHQSWPAWLMTLFGFVMLLPFAIRNLGAVLRDTLVVLGLVGASVLWVVASSRLATEATTVARGPLFLVFIALGIAGILLFLQPWLWRVLDRVVFGRTHDQQAELQSALHRLSPELGVEACAMRALHDLVRVLQLRAAALIFRDGGTTVEGSFAIQPLARIWPTGEAAERLLPRTQLGGELGELPVELREARVEAGVVAVLEVRGSKRLWAHLLLTTDLVGASLREEDLRAIEAFADQLGLLLDGAALLARTIDVERSLAHAQKLAALGEVTARIAHEIRNPAAAARSLAQQLAREGGDHTEEHALIVTQLDRIERQVADLLRFGRRDELHFEEIDFASLARRTADDLRASLRASGVELRVEANGAVHGRGDPEKLRQVLINLIENARDALHEKRSGLVSIAVGNGDGRISLEVVDDGPGVDEETLARLFEPFFSRKHEGTGLGLAIAQRTIEAHGGHIEARRRPAGGMRFRIELPVPEPDSHRSRTSWETEA